MKRKQEVWFQFDGHGSNSSGPVEGTNTENLLSKINAAVRKMLIENVTEDGAKITFHIAKAEVDEFVNPER